MEGKADEVRALLAAGVPVDADNGAALIGAMSACSSEGETAELVEVVGVLVEAGADLKRLDDNKNTPLITAAQYCGDKVVSKLVAGGANVNVTNGSGMTPLMIAIFSNRYEAAEALVAKGAKLTKDQAAMVSAMPDPRAKALAQKASKAKAK
jgi:ankyrin repeat protein